jgi:hypothetical protein
MFGKLSAIEFRGVLDATIGVINATAPRPARIDCSPQRRQRIPSVDLPTDRVAHHPAGSCVQNQVK